MFLRELEVDGYGALQGVRVALDAPVTVLYGPNEAGKSTLLRFIRSMLYGFPTRREPVERGEPIHGGRHGGRLRLMCSTGEEWTLERYANDAAGGFVIRDGIGARVPLTPLEWERQELGGVSETLFRQLFAVSLDELHELRSLKGEEVGNYLYHAGVMGGRSLTAARRALAAEMDGLFKPKGTTPEINRLLAAVKETETAIRQSRNVVEAYTEATEALRQTEESLLEAEKELPGARRRLSEARGALAAREWWLKELVAATEERELAESLTNSGSEPLPEGASERWKALLNDRDNAARRLEEMRLTIGKLEREKDELRVNELLLAELPELERLNRMRETAQAKREQLTVALAEIQVGNEQISALISRISPQWEAADLEPFSLSTADREGARRWQTAWAETDRALERLEEEARKLERQKLAWLGERQAAAAQESAAAGQFADMQQSSAAARQFADDSRALPLRADEFEFLPRSRSELLQAWHRFDEVYREWANAKTTADLSSNAARNPDGRDRRGGKRVSTRAGENGRGWKVIAALSALSAAFAAATWLLTGRSSGSLAGAALWLALPVVAAAWRIAAAFQTSAVRPQSDPSLRLKCEQAREQLRQLLVRPETTATALGLAENAARLDAKLAASPGASIDEMWKKLRNAVHHQAETWERLEREADKRREIDRRLGEFEREAEAVTCDIAAWDAKRDTLVMQWRSWLEEKKLPAELTPDGLPELFGLVEQAQTLHRRNKGMRERADMLRAAIGSFEQAAAALFVRCSPPASLQEDAAAAVAALHAEALTAAAVADEAARISANLREATETFAAVGREAEAAASSVRQALQATGEPDEQAFERRLTVDERRRTVRRERAEYTLRLAAGRTETEAEALRALLEAHDEAQLMDRVREAEAETAALESRRTVLLDRRGRLSQELERLRAEADEPGLAQTLREQESRLAELTERYAVSAVAEMLIRRAKMVFEREKQPEVLQIASRYFSRMTNGRYRRIVVPGDEPVLYAESDERRLVDSAYLSRGTQEQLYLAMRFALADAASRDRPLPLLLDDLFVHFDEKRLRSAIPVLAAIAGTGRQLVLFTCHRHVAQTIEQLLQVARVVSLPERTQRPVAAHPE